MIDFGKYDQKVTFRNFQNVSDGFGGTVPTWVDVITTFASVEQLKSSKDIDHAQIDLDKTYLIKIQYRSSFTPTEKHQIVYRGKTLAITSVLLNDERLSREYWINAKS